MTGSTRFSLYSLRVAGLGMLAILGGVNGCRTKMDRDRSYCRSYAIRLGHGAEIYREQHGHYPENFAILLNDPEVRRVDSGLQRGVELPDTGKYVEFVYGVESGHNFLFSADQPVTGKWVVVYPKVVIVEKDSAPFK